MNRAIIVGSDGQDGRLLAERLARDTCQTTCIGRHHITQNGSRLAPLDVSSAEAVSSLVSKIEPDAVFYLAAVHQSSEEAPPPDTQLLTESWKVNVAGPASFLDAIAADDPTCVFFYAASSLMYGRPSTEVQSEDTPFSPDSIYGITKVAGVHLCRYYRDMRNVKASTGILYNHESPYRRDGFIARRIVAGAVKILRGESDSLLIGDPSARTDWGYAPDFVDAMIRIAELKESGDFIVATGEAHTVQEFVEIAFNRLGLDWRKHVRIDRVRLTRRSSVRIGDYSRLNAATGWKPTVSFPEMVEMLVDAERARRES